LPFQLRHIAGNRADTIAVALDPVGNALDGRLGIGKDDAAVGFVLLQQLE
jgi:hypothetical protein